MRDGNQGKVERFDAATTDEALAERVRVTGDTMAFSELVRRYRVRVIALAHRVLARGGGWDEAEDIAQEAFVAAYKKRTHYRRSEAFRPWLFRIAVNRCLDRLRADARRPVHYGLDDLPEPVEVDADPVRSVLSDEREARLQTAVAGLSPQRRAVFVLRHMEDLSYSEIAAATGLPMGTVKAHLFRARADLRAELTGYLEP